MWETRRCARDDEIDSHQRKGICIERLPGNHGILANADDVSCPPATCSEESNVLLSVLTGGYETSGSGDPNEIPYFGRLNPDRAYIVHYIVLDGITGK